MNRDWYYIERAHYELIEFKRDRLVLRCQRANAPPTPSEIRRAYDEANEGIPLPSRCEPVPIRGQSVIGERLVPEGVNTDKALLYHHGGGHCIGSLESHRQPSFRWEAIKSF